MFTEPNMGLTVWNLLTDLYDHNAQANNLTAIGQHDHSSGKGVKISSAGIANGAVTPSKLSFTPAVYLQGTQASMPLATTVAAGTFYYATDTIQIYESNGSTWSLIMLAGAWTNLTLAAGFFSGASFGGSYGNAVTTPPSVRRFGDMIQFRGSILCSSTGSNLVATIPSVLPALRPSSGYVIIPSVLDYHQLGNGTTPGQNYNLVITPDGKMQTPSTLQVTEGTGLISLEGLSFFWA